MSRRTLADLKKHHKEQTEKKASYDNNGQRNKDVYPFWNMEVGQHAIIRLLEDANENNPNIFFAEKLTHTLSIAGKDRTIPCLTQYGEKCPICELSRAYYKQEGDQSKNGKYYYRKKSAAVRVLVLEDPLPPDPETGETYKGKVIKTFLGNQLLKKMMAQMTDEIDPMNSNPWDVNAGNNFVIKKDNDGKYAVYDLNSKFVSNTSPIPEEYRHLVEEPVDLSTYLPANPGLDKVEKLLSAHQTGEDVEDEEKQPETDEKESVKTESKPEKVVEKVSEKAVAKETSEVATETKSESEVYASIRDRFKGKKQ